MAATIATPKNIDDILVQLAVAPFDLGEALDEGELELPAAGALALLTLTRVLFPTRTP